MQVDFKTDPLEQLDELALRIQAPQRLGNKADWFWMFRESRFGLLARLYGVSEHHIALHSWLKFPRLPLSHEYHISTLFFNMDSALECFVFMLNSLGYGCIGAPFRRTDDSSELGLVRVEDLIGRPLSTPPRAPSIGSHTKLFPITQKLWIARIQLIMSIQEQHDVSKHRSAIFQGGKHSTKPPKNFFRELGVSEEPDNVHEYWPWERIDLLRNPKHHMILKNRPAEELTMSLESLIDEFQALINNSMQSALVDASNYIRSLGI